MGTWRAAVSRGGVFRPRGRSPRRAEKTGGGEHAGTSEKRWSGQSGRELVSVRRSFDETELLNGNEGAVSDEDNRTPGQRGGPEGKARDPTPEFRQRPGSGRRHDDGLGCERSQCRARDTDLLFELHALRCEISSLYRRFAEMGNLNPGPPPSSEAAERTQWGGTGDPVDLRTRRARARICFNCGQSGHLKKQCPHRGRVTGLKGNDQSGRTASLK